MFRIIRVKEKYFEFLQRNVLLLLVYNLECITKLLKRCFSCGYISIIRYLSKTTRTKEKYGFQFEFSEQLPIELNFIITLSSIRIISKI